MVAVVAVVAVVVAAVVVAAAPVDIGSGTHRVVAAVAIVAVVGSEDSPGGNPGYSLGADLDSQKPAQNAIKY